MGFKQDFLALEKQPLKDIYALCGESHYFSRLALLILKKRVLGSTGRGLNFHLFDAQEDSEQLIAAAIATIPGLLGKKLIVIRAAHHFDTKCCTSLIEKRASGNVIVFLSSGKFLFRNKDVTLISCALPYQQDMSFWIHYMMKEAGKKVDLAAVDYLVHCFEKDVDSLYQEIQKIISFMGDKETLTLDDLMNLSVHGRTIHVFKTLNQIGVLDLSQCLSLFSGLKFSHEAPLFVFSMIVRQVRKILQYYIHREQGLSDGEAFEEMGILKFFSREFLGQAKKFQKKQLEKILIRCGDIDCHIKTGQQSAWGGVDEVLCAVYSL